MRDKVRQDWTGIPVWAWAGQVTFPFSTCGLV